MLKTCETCLKAIKKENKVTFCRVLTDHKYFPEKYGYCFAWTDEPLWEMKVNLAVEKYKLAH